MAAPHVLALLLGCSAAAAFKGEGERPNIIHILLDDYGWADAGWHRPDGYSDVQTPHFDSLVKEGVELDRHYVFQFCSPTRSAIQSGRNPIHVNVLNAEPNIRNPKDNVSGYAAIPRNMTGMAEHMKRAGYETHMYGKWDAGMATPQHTPHGRGYDSSLFYFHHMNDFWTNIQGQCHGSPVVDLYHDKSPAHGLNNSRHCSQQNQAPDCKYEDTLFAEHVMASIVNRDKSKPYFLFWAPHIVHAPLQVPQAFVDKFSFIDDSPRKMYHAMVNFVDEAVGNMTALLKENGMWNNTLIILHADNGGPIYAFGSAGANNWPLKGGKMSNWEGGVRVNAFASGGFLPEGVRGTKNEGYMCGWDWYATFCALAGVDPRDDRAEAAGLPGVDGLNLWPFLSGQVAQSPRTVVPIGDSENDVTKLGALIKDEYKVIFGSLTQSGWTGPQYPNTTGHWNPSQSVETCGRDAATGCLFNIRDDPTEHVNLASTHQAVYNDMLSAAAEVERTLFSPERGTVDPAACEMVEKNGGFWGPFAFLDDEN